MTVKQVLIYVNENQINYGYYEVKGTTLTMMRQGQTEDGKFVWVPLLYNDETPFSAQLSPGSNETEVAKRLTRKYRTLALGEDTPGFWSNSMQYQRDGSII